MDEEEKSVSNLVAQSKNIGYYAGLTYGIGYILMYIGAILVIIELLAYLASIVPSQYWSQMPAWFYAGLVLYIISALFAIVFGSAVIKSAKIVRESELRLENLSSPISIFSCMLIIQGIASVILVAGINSMGAVKLSLVGPICGIVGPILLLIGFKTYQIQKASESRFIATILMIISLVLIYFISIEQLRTLLDMFFSSSIPLCGPLGCEFRLEFIALLIALVSAMLVAFRIFKDKMQQSVTNVILSISGIVFSVGLMYYNFSSASTISDIMSMLRSFAGYGLPTKEFYSLWIVLIGLIILGIAGIIALVASIMPLALAAKQFSTEVSLPKPEAPAPPAPPTEEAAGEVKYCPKCGAKMPKDAAYCPKCGQKQPKT